MNIFSREPKPTGTQPLVPASPPPFWETGLAHHLLAPDVPLMFVCNEWRNAYGYSSLTGRLFFRYYNGLTIEECCLDPKEIEPHATAR